MPLERLRFQIHGDVQDSRAFEVYAREAEDMSEPLAEIAESLRLSVSEQFRTEGAHGGRPWQPLNAAYARWKAMAVGAKPILVFTGLMRSDMTSRSSFTITPRRMVYEPNDQKAVWHQDGAGNLPARKMVELNQGDRRQWDRHFATWLNGLRRGPMGAHL